MLGAANTPWRIPAGRLRGNRRYGAEQHDRGEGAQKRFHDITISRYQSYSLDNAPGSLRVPEKPILIRVNVCCSRLF
jgi:hypothetical protein